MKLALISDVHEDIINLKLALHKIEKLGCDEIICLGDISGFSVPNYRYFDTRNAHECLKLVKENCRVIVLGNHDLQAAALLPVNTDGFNFPDNWYDLDYHERKALGDKKVWLYDHDELDPLYTHGDKKLLRTLPEFEIGEYEGKKILFSHYLYPNLNGAMIDFYHTLPEYKPHLDFMEANDCNLGFAGHYHFSGCTVGTRKRLIRRGFKRKMKLEYGSVVIIPPISGTRMNNGFCIFDCKENRIRAVRI